MRYLSGVSLDIYNLVQRLAAIVNISEKTKIASDAVVNLRYSYDSEYVYGILYTYMYMHVDGCTQFCMLRNTYVRR